MSAHKYIIVLAFAFAAVLTVNTVPANGAENYATVNKSHHLIVGYRLPGDRLVLQQNVVKGSSWLKVQTIQKTFNITRNERITMVRALDQKTDGTGAYASLLHGGPGHNNVTMKFKSQRGRGVNFVVEIYGRP